MGGRWLRQVRKASRSRRNKRNLISPIPRNNHQLPSHAAEAEPHTQVELRRSSRLINTLPRSDYSISERWSYGTDVYETRYDTADFKQGDSTKSSTGISSKRSRASSYGRKKHKSLSSAGTNSSDECVAYCTRSRTALKSRESACEQALDSPNQSTNLPLPLDQNDSLIQSQQLSHSQAEGLLPLDERDFAYSPFSSSTITELLDSDYSVYSPTTTGRRKGKKRKRSAHRSLSHRKSNYLLDFEECRKKFKTESHREVSESVKDHVTNISIPEYEPDRGEVSLQSCSYRLRNRHNRDLGPPTSTVISENTGMSILSPLLLP